MKPRKRFRTGGALPFVDPEFAKAMSIGRPRGRDGGRRENRQQHHKTLQLCRQAQRAISLALAGECDDEVLRRLYVDSVTPAPDASRLMVCVIVPRHVEGAVEDVLWSLERVKGLLRAAVARDITRKRAPELTFLTTREPEVTP